MMFRVVNLAVDGVITHIYSRKKNIEVNEIQEIAFKLDLSFFSRSVDRFFLTVRRNIIYLREFYSAARCRIPRVENDTKI